MKVPKCQVILQFLRCPLIFVCLKFHEDKITLTKTEFLFFIWGKKSIIHLSLFIYFTLSPYLFFSVTQLLSLPISNLSLSLCPFSLFPPSFCPFSLFPLYHFSLFPFTLSLLTTFFFSLISYFSILLPLLILSHPPFLSHLLIHLYLCLTHFPPLPLSSVLPLCCLFSHYPLSLFLPQFSWSFTSFLSHILLFSTFTQCFLFHSIKTRKQDCVHRKEI